MATWQTNTTSTDEISSSFWDKPKEIAGNIIHTFVIISVLLVLFMIFILLGSGKLSTERFTPEETLEQTEIDQDKDISPTDLDKTFWISFNQILSTMKYGASFTLDDGKAAEFGAMYVPEDAGITFTNVSFSREKQTVTVHYQTERNLDITLTIKNNHISKKTIKYHSLSNGNFLEVLWWYGWGKFHKGYPIYNYEASMENGYAVGSETVKKRVCLVSFYGKVMQVLS